MTNLFTFKWRANITKHNDQVFLNINMCLLVHFTTEKRPVRHLH